MDSIENMRLGPYNSSKKTPHLANTEKNQWYIKPIVLYKILSPKWPSTHQHTMKDKWLVVRKQFFIGF